MISSCGPPGQAPRRRYRRRAIVLAHLLCVGLYLERFEQGRVWAPEPCPDNCQGGCWRAHSSFGREWVDADCVSFQLTIIRLQCSVCRGVWSLFPAFIWYRHRFSYQMVQSACWQVLSGVSAMAVVQQLSERVSPILEDRARVHVPDENTVRAWAKWLGQPCLGQMLHWTLSLITRISPEAGRAVAPTLPEGRACSQQRTRGFLNLCATLHAVRRGSADFFRRSPHQLRDWAVELFCERRQVLARPP
jgi:hypothetical protein